MSPAPAQPFEEGGQAGERLQKVLARAGMGSRRTCEDLIAAGRVTVNGQVASLGRRVEPVSDRVEVDGVALGVAPGLVYYLLNKPRGVVTTASDPQGRPTVVALVPNEPRVFPVGRLDADTEGLVLLTNDGSLAHRLTHPSVGVAKEYLAEVEGVPSDAALARLRRGVMLEDGPTAPARVGRVAPNAVRITIHEGRNRQVRRMCEAIGHPVARLVRSRIGPLSDRSLRPGQWRALTTEEVRSLERATAAGGGGAPPGGGAGVQGTRRGDGTAAGGGGAPPGGGAGVQGTRRGDGTAAGGGGAPPGGGAGAQGTRRGDGTAAGGGAASSRAGGR